MVGKLGKPYKPFRQLMGDCNPSYEHHWINRDIQEGRITGFQSRHEDNPRYHNGHGWTKEGDEYLTQQLGTLTGFMRARLLIGQWAMAEGLVYDTFDEKIHVLPASFTIPESWPRYWSIDWGWTDPLVLQFWAKDGDGRLYLYREYYMTEKLVEDVAKWAKNEIEMKREPRPKAIVCDHDPENAATFMRHSGLSCTLADKLDKKGGIQKVKERLIVRGDGRPRLFIIQGALTHPIDSKLRGKGKPTRLTDELRSYAWEPKRDEPQDGNDHGCDAMLYVVRHVDAGGGWGIK
jgi:phage terminase large subunit